MFKSAAIALFLGVASAENLITISLKPEAAQWFQGKGDLLGAHVDSIFASGEFQDFVAKAQALEKSPSVANQKLQSAKFNRMAEDTVHEFVDVVETYDRELQFSSEPLPSLHIDNSAFAKIEKEERELLHQY